MKINKSNQVCGRGWIKSIIVSIVAIAGFSYLYRHGISPVWTAVAIVAFPGFFRFIYKIACLLVALASIIAILSLLIY